MLESGYDYASLALSIKAWGRELGFQAVGVADTDLSAAEGHLASWLGRGWHGEMDYMARHGTRRARPGDLVPGTLRVIACRMNYVAETGDGWPESMAGGTSAKESPASANSCLVPSRMRPSPMLPADSASKASGSWLARKRDRDIRCSSRRRQKPNMGRFLGDSIRPTV